MISFQLLLVLFAILLQSNRSNSIEQECKCGECDLNAEDKNLSKCIDLQAELELVDKVPVNRGVCLNYKVRKNGDCRFPPKLVNAWKEDILLFPPDSNTGHLRSPGLLEDRCHRSQQFCAFKIDCPKLKPMIVDLDLPREKDGTCNDKLLLTIGGNPTIEICGDQSEVNDWNDKIGVAVHPVTIRFHSSQCCHNCGFRINVICDRSDSDASPIPFFQRPPLKDQQRIINHGYSQPKSELFKLQVPSLATLTYEDSTITVTKSGTSLYRIPDIKVLKLTDIPGGRRTLFGESNYKFSGYGHIVVENDHAEYIYTGLPPEERPTKEENEYIFRTSALLTPYLARATSKSYNDHDNQFRNLLLPEELSRNRPKCQINMESIITGQRTTACQEFQERIQMPPTTEISKAISEARFQLRTSTNGFVLAVAHDVLNFLIRKEPPKRYPKPQKYYYNYN